MSRSRSTPRVRILAALMASAILLVAVSERSRLPGMAGQLAQWAGFGCVVIAALWRIWASVFIAGYKDATLVTAGPYATCRHPLYAGSLLAALGIGLTTRSAALAIALPVISAVLHARAVAAEESLLLASHGRAFEQYRNEVPKFWPAFSRYAVPETLLIQPAILRKAFLDAGSILGAWLLVCVADRLQAAGLTPTLLHLP
jgi:protein-S-isoprenylcysteine O-methyltransferase Ste14